MVKNHNFSFLVSYQPWDTIEYAHTFEENIHLHTLLGENNGPIYHYVILSTLQRRFFMGMGSFMTSERIVKRELGKY